MKTKHKVNRLLSCLLVLLMIVSMVSVMSVSAATTGTTSDGLEYKLAGNQVTITGYSGSDDWLTIPAEIGGYPVTSIGDYAFSDCYELFYLELPEGITSIGAYAFSGCYNLFDLELPESLTSLGEYWLSGCDNIEYIRIPGGITSVEPYTFSGFNGDIEFSYGVTNIESYAFEGYGTYDSFSETGSAIYFPYTLTSIEDFGFSGCCAERIELPTGVESIGFMAFEGCPNLKEMVISNSVKSIGEAVFVDCDSLETVMIFSDNITSFGQDNMFVRCSNLKTVFLPDGITSIGSYMFYSCENLETVITGDMYEEWSQGLETVNTLPDSVTSIEEYAFYNCAALKELTIPVGVTSIGDSAFSECYSLTDIYYKGTQKQWEQIELGEYNECLINATIHYSEPVAEVTGNSITLSGDIGVNFYMTVKDDVLADEDAAVIFTYDDKVVEVPVSQGTGTENGYKYTCNIPAKDMTTKVTCKVVSSSSESEEYVYSIKEYAEIILANPDTYGEEAVALVKSMLNYGAAAQSYFGYKTSSLANDTEYMTDEDRVVAAKDFSNLSYSLTEGEGAVKYYGTALSLKSEVGIKHYFTVDETADVDTLTVTVDGEPAELVQNGDLYEMIIPDIAAHNLYTDYVVQVGNVGLSYCAMDYAATAQKIYGAGGLLRLMYALDAYAQNAIAYAN